MNFLNWKRNLGSRWGVKNYDNDYCCFKTKSTLYFHSIWNHKEERISRFCCFLLLLLVLVKPRYNRKSPLSGAIHHFSGFMHEVYTCIWTEAKRLRYSSTSPYYLLGYSQVCFASCVKPYLLLQSRVLITIRLDVLCLPTINKVLNGLLFAFSSLHNTLTSSDSPGEESKVGNEESWVGTFPENISFSLYYSMVTKKRFSLHNISS